MTKNEVYDAINKPIIITLKDSTQRCINTLVCVFLESGIVSKTETGLWEITPYDKIDSIK